MSPTERDNPLIDTALSVDGSTQAEGSSEEIEKLRFSEESFRALVQNALDVILVMGANQTVSYISPAVERILGYKPEEVIGKNNFSVVHPDDMDRVGELTTEALKNPGSTTPSIQLRLRHRDGSWRHVETSCTNLLEDPTVGGIVFNCRDITERKKAEEALKESEERFRSAFEEAPIGMAVSALDGQFVQVNRSLCQILGYSEEELLATTFLAITLPDDQGAELDRIRRMLEGEDNASQAENRCLHAAGHVVWISFNASVVRDPEGCPLYFIAQVQDITERRRAEEALEESEERFRALVRNASDVITVLDADGTVSYVSPAIERMLGYRTQDRVGRSCFELLHPEDLPRARSTFVEALQNPGVNLTLGVRMRCRDGSWRHVELTGTNLLDDPSVVGVVINWRDVTERVRAERVLRESEQRFRSSFRDAAIGMALVGIDGRWLQVNGSLCQIVGYSEEELLEKTFQDITHPDDLEADLGHVRRMLAGEIETYQMEKHYLHKEGHVVWIQLSVSLVHDEEGEPLYFIAQVQDITERKRVEGALKESEERFRTTFEDAPIGVALVDLDGRRFRVNRALCEMLGCCREDLLGKVYLEQVHPDDRNISTERFRQTLEEGTGSYELERRYLRADGHVVWNLTSVSLIGDFQGNLSHFVCLHQDITERKQAEEALRHSEEFFRALYEDVHHPIFILNKDLNFVDVNPYACEFYGYSREEFRRMKVQDIVHPEELEDQLEAAETMRTQGKIFVPERRHQKKNGETVTVTVDVARITRSGQELYVSKITDITERKLAEKRLRYQATHDLLTDLPNRHLFTDRLRRALRLTRHRKGSKVAVLYLDLDDFKNVNDSLGHEAGDLLLAVVGERLRWCLRSEDTLARFGGDEFAVLLEEVEAPSDAAEVAERIVERFREPFVMKGREFTVTPSIGIALGTARQNTAQELLRDADSAMYQAKGRDDHYRVFDPYIYEQALRRLKLESDLKRAIEKEELVLCYQPIVDLESGEAWGVEALVRWKHPEQQGLLAPSQFVSVAEEAGLIVPMGRWVIKEACRQGAKWQREHPHVPPLALSVNLSAKQLQHPGVVETVEETLEETGFEPSFLTLDITETLYVGALKGDTAALDKLKNIGVRISIDDFGTGYSSLAYLKQLSADILKIDKSFVAGIGENVEDTAIVQMVIDLAHTLGMEVIAEGVESEVQVEQLKEMGCDRGQGYHVAGPLYHEEVSKFLAG